MVLEIAGSFDFLVERAERLEVAGCKGLVAYPDDLLATLPVPRRVKDAPRVRELRELQRSWAVSLSLAAEW